MANTDKKFVIEFRNGRFLVNLDADNSGPLRLAMRFATREDADNLMREHEWILWHGGAVLERVQVHADGGDCDGTPLVDNRCPKCGIAPDMQSVRIAAR